MRSPLIIKLWTLWQVHRLLQLPCLPQHYVLLREIGVACPECGNELVERRTRRGRIFYGCITYPECEYSVWNRPLPAPCPLCGGLLVEDKKDWVKCMSAKSSSNGTR